MIWRPAFSVLPLLLFLLAYSADGDTRKDAFINYSEVSLEREEYVDPASVVAVGLQSQYGQVRLQLRRDWAPNTCDEVAKMAAGALKACPGCTLYRHEPAPENWGVNKFFGPPYGLLQGGLPGLISSITHENAASRAVTRGVAAFIVGSNDFFIGTVDHSEWGGSFTPFAQVPPEDLDSVVARVPLAPYRNSTDAYNFTTRWLLERIPFKLVPLQRKDLLMMGGGAGSGEGEGEGGSGGGGNGGNGDGSGRGSGRADAAA